jgi:hypothetical protein
MRVRLPVRATSALTAGVSTRVRLKTRRGERRRYRQVLETRPIVRHGAVVSLRGRLVDPGGNARGGAPVEVLERSAVPGSEWRYLTTVRTTPAGSFGFRAASGSSRTFRFRYAGSALTQPASADVEVRVRAGATIRPDRKRLRNGDSVIFRGRLLGKPLPAAGKLVLLQARTRRGWRTFASPRARAGDGKWEFRYRFTGTTVRSLYAFRVVVPEESSYPYARGTSRIVTVLVTP